MSPFYKDFLERLGWTVAEVVLATIIVAVGDLDGVYVPIITSALMAIKGLVARKVGDPESAALAK